MICTLRYALMIVSPALQFSPAISKNSSRYVHHILIYLCTNLNHTHVGASVECDNANAAISLCWGGGTLIGAWAVGGEVSGNCQCKCSHACNSWMHCVRGKTHRFFMVMVWTICARLQWLNHLHKLTPSIPRHAVVFSVINFVSYVGICVPWRCSTTNRRRGKFSVYHLRNALR